MLISPLLVATLAIILTAISATSAIAQVFPSKPIRMLTTEPGGGSDVMARLIAQGLSISLGRQVVVENRPSGIIVGNIAASAPPDGYTILLSGSGLWLVPLLQEAPFDPVRDFASITLPARAPNVLVVHPSVPVKSVKELITLAKSRTGALNYSSGSTGAIAHLAAELFKSKAAVSIVRVNYKGAGPALNGVIAGEVEIMFPSAGSASGHIASGRLKVLAVTSAAPSELFPELPTIASAGLPGYEAESPFGIFAPAKTPEAIISRLNQEILRVINRPEMKDRFLKMSLETIGSSPEQLQQTVKSEVVKWGQVIKEAGIGK